MAVALAAAYGVAGHAAGIFLPAGLPAPTSQAAQDPAGELHRSYFVRIAHDELQRAHAEVESFGESRLLLNMSERMKFDVALERTVRTPEGYTLSGQIDGGKSGFVTLVVHPEAIAGSIWTWKGSYEIASVGGGIHAIHQVTHDPLECGGVHAQTDELPTSTLAPPTSNEDGTPNTGNDHVEVDILVFWTPDRERLAGAATGVRAEIDLAIAFTNDALERSGALVSLNLVGAERLDAEESSTPSYFELLGGSHATSRADALGADFVSVAISRGGLAMGSWSLFSSPYIFAHEIGHNLCLRHDRATSLLPAHSYNGGYVHVDRGSCFGTIMSYPDRCSQQGLRLLYVPYYASPNRYHPVTGMQLGVSRLSNNRTWDGPADAVLAMNRCRHSRSDIRPRP